MNMNYTEKYHQLKVHFTQEADKTLYPDSDITCHWVKFESGNTSKLAEERD